MTSAKLKKAIHVEDQWGDRHEIPEGANVKINKPQGTLQEVIYKGISYFLPTELLIQSI